MCLLLGSLFHRSPFEGLKKHAAKVKECGVLLRKATICHLSHEYKQFDLIAEQVARLESEADDVKRNIRNHLPKGILMPVDKFAFFDYLREQDKVLDEVEEALFWLSFRPRGIPDEVANDIEHLVDVVVPPIEELFDLVALARDYFRSKTQEQRNRMKSLIRNIRQHEREADLLERELKFKVFKTIRDPMVLFHLIRLVEILGEIPDHAQNASDRMRAMIAR